MGTEKLYLGHGNTIDLILKADGTAVDLSTVTKITATFNGTTITSVDSANGTIKWSGTGFDTGEIRLDCGGETIPVGTYDVDIVVYDPSNTDGVVWGPVRIEVIANMEV